MTISLLRFAFRNVSGDASTKQHMACYINRALRTKTALDCIYNITETALRPPNKIAIACSSNVLDATVTNNANMRTICGRNLDCV